MGRFRLRRTNSYFYLRKLSRLRRLVLANYIFSVDGAETGTVGGRGTAFVYNLDFFDKTDTVSASSYGGTLDFEIEGAIDLNLNGYSGITGFDTVMGDPPPAISTSPLTRRSSPSASPPARALGRCPVRCEWQAVVLDASAISRYQSVNLDARSDGHNVLIGGAFPDTSSGGAGADHFDGGDGNDRGGLERLVGGREGRPPCATSALAASPRVTLTSASRASGARTPRDT